MKHRKQFDRKKLIRPIFPLIGLIVFINVFPPDNLLMFGIFYVLLYVFLLFFFQIFFPGVRSFIWATIFLTYLVFRQYKFDNVVNLLLLGGIFLTFEVYFRKR